MPGPLYGTLWLAASTNVTLVDEMDPPGSRCQSIAAKTLDGMKVGRLIGQKKPSTKAKDLLTNVCGLSFSNICSSTYRI